MPSRRGVLHGQVRSGLSDTSLGKLRILNGVRGSWWTHLDLNQGPLACEASALTGLSYASTRRSIIAPADVARKGTCRGPEPGQAWQEPRK